LGEVGFGFLRVLVGDPRRCVEEGGALRVFGVEVLVSIQGLVGGGLIVFAAWEWGDRLDSKVCEGRGVYLGLYQGTSYNGLNTLLAF
jgi:hypothetical protein